MKVITGSAWGLCALPETVYCLHLTPCSFYGLFYILCVCGWWFILEKALRKWHHQQHLETGEKVCVSCSTYWLCLSAVLQLQFYTTGKSQKCFHDFAFFSHQKSSNCLKLIFCNVKKATLWQHTRRLKKSLNFPTVTSTRCNIYKAI